MRGFAKPMGMYSFLVLLTAFSAVGLQGWRTLINNFAVEQVYFTGYQMGVVQSLREVPGLLAFVVVYILLLVREHRLAVLSVLVLGVGVGLTGVLPSFGGIICTTLLMSFGFHYYETVNQSLTLQYFDIVRAPVVLGRLRAVASVANIAVGAFIFLASKFLNYSQLFAVLGILIFAGGAACWRADPTEKGLEPQHKNMVFRKRYWLFYLLTLLGGARRQIFIAFAVFLLVERFHYSIQEVTVLFVLNNIINYFVSPLIGKAINRFGERKVLSLEYGSLIGIFLVYAFTDSRILVGIMYVLDFVFFNFAIGIRSYFQKIGDPKDIASSMAVGFTINHIAAVVIPVVGGLLWMMDYRIPFILGAALSVASLAATQCIRLRPQLRMAEEPGR